MAIQKVKNKNGEWVIVSGVNKPLTIDSTLSDTSINPVQNRVIKQYIDNAVQNIDVDAELSDASENPVQSKAIKQYVDNAIQNVEIAVDSELSNTSENPIQNKVITEVVTNKQDKIEDIETIRSGAALGATALQEHQDISHLATKEELTSLTNEMIANEEVTAASLNDLDARVSAIAENISGSAATKEELEAAVATLEAADTANSEAITAVDGKVDTLETTVVENYATKSELQTEVDTLNGTITTLQNEVIANEEVTAASLNEINDRVNQLSANVSSESATKVELQDAVTSLTNTILENEEISASAFNDINNRLQAIIMRLEALENV